jgi:hypothetical protein
VTAFQHRRQERVRERDECRDVQRDLFLLASGRNRFEAAVRAEAGIVHQ